MDHRSEILDLLSGKSRETYPSFSGLVHVTEAGLLSEGLHFADVHGNSEKMQRLAGSTFKLSGLPSAAVPFDLCLEAEALGARINFSGSNKYDFPRVIKYPYLSVEEVIQILEINGRELELQNLGRIPVVCQAIQILRSKSENRTVIGGILAGPFTVLSMLIEQSRLFRSMKNQPDRVLDALAGISRYVSWIGNAYRKAGADFLTVHEMGGSPDVLGQKSFVTFVWPALTELFSRLERPRVLAICGNLQKAADLLKESDADAISADQSNDLKVLRTALPGKVLFGNIDPVGVLAASDPSRVREIRKQAIHEGADAIWPGCDLRLETPIENLRALMD